MKKLILTLLLVPLVASAKPPPIHVTPPILVDPPDIGEIFYERQQHAYQQELLDELEAIRAALEQEQAINKTPDI